MSEFKILSLNCRGLHDVNKRKDVFKYLREQKASLYCLQDTHCTENDKSVVYAQWGLDFLMSPGNSNSRGTLTLTNNNFEYTVLNVKSDPNGNYIVSSILVDNKYSLTIVNLYGPNRDSPDFFRELSNIIEEFSDDFIIMCGDWNLVQNFNLDCHNYVKENNLKNKLEVIKLQEKFNLVDPWRINNPDARIYTWSKKTPIKQARLDFFLISEELMSLLHSVSILPGYRTDHSIIELQLKFNNFTKGKGFWRFNNSLLRDPTYVQKVKDTIAETELEYREQGNPVETEISTCIDDDLFLEILLMKIRQITIYYASKKSKERKKQKELLERQIKFTQDLFNTYHLISYAQALSDFQDELEKIRKYELDGLLLRTHCKWIENGEKPTKYFCALEKRNYVNKNVTKLINSKGKCIVEQNEILTEIKKFYQVLYKNYDDQIEDIDLNDLFTQYKIHIPKVNEMEQQLLDNNITLSEILCSLKNMKNDKTPGTDGFTTEFFKFFWIDLNKYILKSYQCSFKKGYLSISQTRGIISIIPKGNKPREQLKNWRPISLLNTTYKILSAVLANRMKPLLSSLIHENQKGFLKGRYIGENSRLLYDVIHYCNENKVPGLVLLIDFEKAFDSVSWSFMFKVLHFFHFGEIFIKWVKILFSKASLCVIQNGFFSDFFEIGRGCRQGDPISPYLFILCAEIMGILIRNNLNIKGIVIAGKEYKLLQYADDTVLLLDGSKKSLKNALSLIDQFAKYSGLKPNYDKTLCVKIGSLSNCKQNILPEVNIRWSQEPFTVLGITYCIDLNPIAMHELNFLPKLCEMKKLVASWSKRLLSPAGKITVIKSIILPKIIHLIIALPNPPSCYMKELEQLFFNFIWNNKPPRVAKKCITQNYEDGGLRMIDLNNLCTSLKITWIRRFLNYTSSWKSLLLSTLPKIENIFLYGNMFTKVLSSCCTNLFWRDVFDALFKFRKIVETEVSESVVQPIWYNENFKINNNFFFYECLAQKGVLYVYDFFSTNGQILQYEDFCDKFDVLIPFTTYYGIVNNIKMLKLPYDVNTIMFNNPYYPVFLKPILKNIKGSKEIYDIITATSWEKPKYETKWENELNLDVDRFWWKLHNRAIFKISTDVQIQWFQYRIVHRILTTNVFLKRIGIVQSDLCSFCDLYPENLSHIFWECTYVEELWNSFFEWINDQTNMMIDANIVDILFGKLSKHKNIINLLIILVKRHIYKKRNNKMLPSFEGLKREILYYRNLEHYMYKKNNNEDNFYKRWDIFSSLQ